MMDRDQYMLSRLIDRGTIEPVSRRVVGIHEADQGEVEELKFRFTPRPYDPTYGTMEETRYRCTYCGQWVVPDESWPNERVPQRRGTA